MIIISIYGFGILMTFKLLYRRENEIRKKSNFPRLPVSPLSDMYNVFQTFFTTYTLRLYSLYYFKRKCFSVCRMERVKTMFYRAFRMIYDVEFDHLRNFGPGNA